MVGRKERVRAKVRPLSRESAIGRGKRGHSASRCYQEDQYMSRLEQKGSQKSQTETYDMKETHGPEAESDWNLGNLEKKSARQWRTRFPRAP